MALPRVVAVALFGVTLIAGHARAQEGLADLFGRPVASIRFEVEGREDTSPALLPLVSLAVGQPLTQENVRASVVRLTTGGRFEQANVVATRSGEGVDVTVRLTPRHPVTRLEVRGNSGMAPGALRSRILQRYGGMPTTVRSEAVEAAARLLLNDEGYLDVTITPSLEISHDPESATLILNVEAGAQSRIRATTVMSAILPQADVVRRTQTQPGQPFRRRAISTALTVIEDDLRERGYYEAEGSFTWTVAADGVDLAIRIDEGPRVELRVTPSDALPGGSIEDFIPIRREGSADQDLLEDSRRRIEAALKAEGYWQAVAPFTTDLQNGGALLVIRFTISRGPRFFVQDIDLPPGLVVPATTLRDLIDIAPGDVFNQATFELGMQRVIDAYRTRGYYRASAAPEYQIVGDRSSPTEARVALHPNITEGPRGQVERVDFSFVGSNRVPEPELRRVMRSQPGQPFIEADAATDEAALRTVYRNLGFRNASVRIEPQFSNTDQDVGLHVTIAEEQQVVIGEILVVGNERVSTAAILDELDLIVGQPLGEAALAAASLRLTDMGVFRRASVTVEDAGPGDSDARIVISVVESPATSIGFGGGLEGETRNVERDDDTVGSGFELSPRGFFEIGRRNLWGRNRAVSLFARANLRPRSDTDFFEYRVTGTYREQRAFRTDTTLLLSVTSEQAHRTSFNFLRRAVNAELLRRLTPRLSVSGRYGLDFTRLFDETFSDADQPDIDRLFPQVRLSTLSSGVTWDRRDNPLVPTRGIFATADVELAARVIGSEVGYAKTVFQVSAFRRLRDSVRTVLAVRGQVGLAQGFERTVPEVADGAPVFDENGHPILRVIRDLPISKRFFSGGSTTVRGFPVDRLGLPIEGPLDPMGVLNPNGLSRGGNAVVILNAELRRVVGRVLNRSLAVVGFVDGGNVFADAIGVDVNRLRTTYGFGARYDSPLGPIRLDLGIKTERLLVGTQRESGWEYHLSIGEAF